MAIISQFIKSIFTTKGAEQTAAASDKVAKSQKKVAAAGTKSTRAFQNVGKASASAGRQFGAQAQGLGGLVTVYAGAAANIFAIQQAFSALARAAQATQIITGTRTLAVEIGVSGDSIIRKIQEITEGQLSMVDIAEQVNNALSAGFSAKQIERLANVANKTARALGRTLPDAMGRLVRGAGKMEPELLDELGIFARIDPAVQAYADSLNRATSSLSTFEKRQAFILAVLDEGERKFSIIDTSVESTQKSFENLAATMADMGIVVGQTIGDVLKPMADFFSKNLGNAITLFGLIGLTVFGTLRNVFRDFINNSINKLHAGVERLTLRFSKLGPVAQESLNKAAKASADAFKGTGPLGGGKERQAFGKSLKEQLKAGKINLRQARELTPEISKQLEIEKSIRKELRLQAKAGKDVTTQLTKSGARSGALNKSLKVMKTTIVESGKAANIMAVGFQKAAKGVEFMIRGFGRLLTALNVIVGVFSLLQFFTSFIPGVDIMGDIAKAIKEMGRASRDAKEATSDLFDSLIMGKGAADDLISRLGLTKNKIKELVKETKELLLSNIAMGKIEAPDVEGVIETATVFEKKPALPSFTEQQSKLVDVFRKKVNNLTGELLDVTKALKGPIDETKKLGLRMEEAAIKGRLLLAESVITNIEKGKIALRGVQEELKKITEFPGRNIAQLISEGFLDITRDAGEVILSVGEATAVIGHFDRSLQTTTLTKGLEELSGLMITSKITAENFSRAFKAGALDAAKAGQSAAAVSLNVKKLMDLYNKLSDAKKKAIEDEGFGAVIRELREASENASKAAVDLSSLEKIGKDIRGTFGTQIKLVDNLLASGEVSITGRGFAETGTEKLRNQTEFLAEMVKLGTEQNDKEADSLEKKKNGLAASKALFGLAFSLTKEIEKTRKAEEKRLEQLTTQMKLLEAQNDLLELRNDLAVDKTQEQFRISIAQEELKILKSRNTFLISDLAESVALLNNRKKLIEAETEIRDLRRDQVDAQIALTSLMKERGLNRAALREAAGVDALDLLGPLATDKDRIESELRVAKVKFRQDMQVIKEGKENADLEFKRSMEDIASRKELLEKDDSIVARKLQGEKDRLARQLVLIDIEAKEAKVQRTIRLGFIEQERDIAESQRKLQVVQAKNQRDLKISGLEIVRAEAQLIKDRIAIVNMETASFETFAMALADILAPLIEGGITSKDVKELFKTQIQIGFGAAETVLRNVQTSIDRVNGIYAEQVVAANEVRDATVGKLNIEKDAIKKLAALAKKDLILKKANAIAQSNATQIALEADAEVIARRLTGLDLERETTRLVLESELVKLGIQEDTAEQAIQIARRRAALEKNILFQLFKETASIIENHMGNALRALNRAFLEGVLTMENFKEGFKEFLRNMILELGDAVTTKLVIDPFKEFLLGGGDPQQKLASTVTSVSGAPALRVVMAGGLGGKLADIDGFDPDLPPIEEEYKSFLVRIFDFTKLGIGSIFGEGGVFVKALSLVGNIGIDVFRSIATSIINMGGAGSSGGFLGAFASLFASNIGSAQSSAISQGLPVGFTHGGLVQRFANGGQVRGRDSVPAMLEPGEFVLRRGTTEKLGEPALNKLNSGGGGRLNPNVSVNINNTGTPQETEGPIDAKFDGEKMILDVFLRDIENNGPMRRSIKGLRG